MADVETPADGVRWIMRDPRNARLVGYFELVLSVWWLSTGLTSAIDDTHMLTTGDWIFKVGSAGVLFPGFTYQGLQHMRWGTLTRQQLANGVDPPKGAGILVVVGWGLGVALAFGAAALVRLVEGPGWILGPLGCVLLLGLIVVGSSSGQADERGEAHLASSAFSLGGGIGLIAAGLCVWLESSSEILAAVAAIEVLGVATLLLLRHVWRNGRVE